MDRRDRAVAGGLALALAIIVAAMSAPVLVPSIDAGPGDVPAPSSTTTQVYREGMLSRPVSVNPLTARTDADRALVGLVFSGLLRLGPGDTLRPDLARWWRAEEGGSVWVVRIADDAQWQDGEPVTSADVAFTAHALADPVLASPQGPSWANVSVEVIDDRTVRFVLAEPLGGFPWLLTQPLAPAHLLSTVPLDSLSEDPFGQAPVGTGPFRMARWDTTSAILEAVRPNPVDPSSGIGPTPRPSRPVPYLGGLEIDFYQDGSTMATDLERGALDGAVGLGGATDAATDLRLSSYPGTTLSTIVLNLRPGHKELRDSRVRIALLAAVDRDGIVASAADGLAQRAESPIPPSSSLFDPAVSVPIEHDPAAAGKLLADAGWRRLSAGGWAAPGSTKQYAVTILTPSAATAPRLVEAARAVASDWSSLGIRAEVEEVDFPELVDRLHAGDFTAALVDIAIGHDPDLYPILASSQVVSSGLNVSGIQDPKLDPLLLAARQAIGEDARKEAYSKLQDYLAKGRYLVTLYFAELPFTLSGRLAGPAPHQIAQAGDRYWDVLTWRLASGR